MDSPPELVPTPEPVAEPPRLTVDQRALAAAKKYAEHKKANPKSKQSPVSFAQEAGVSQGYFGLAQRVIDFAPEYIEAVEQGTKTLVDLEPLTGSRFRSRARIQVRRAMPPAGIIWSGPARLSAPEGAGWVFPG
jgi:hypothetical protein